jgi:hypothetical protein
MGPLRPLWLGTFLWGIASWGPSRAEAAAIHRDDAHDSVHVDAAKFKTWSEYLMGGPTVWSAVAHPALTPAIEASMWKSIRNDPPPDTSPVVNFFLYRQSIAPRRFDHYHPNVAKALAKIEAQLLSPSNTTPTTTTTSPGDQAQQLTPSSSTPTPPTVPEPTTLLLAIGLTGYAAWWRRRR